MSSQVLRFMDNLEEIFLGVFMPCLKICRALSPWVLARGIPWMTNKGEHQMLCWFKESPSRNPSPNQWSQGLTASQPFHMLLITKEPCMWMGSYMMRRVWKPITFHVGLVIGNLEEIQCRTRIFQASSPVMAQIIHFHKEWGLASIWREGQGL